MPKKKKRTADKIVKMTDSDSPGEVGMSLLYKFPSSTRYGNVEISVWLTSQKLPGERDTEAMSRVRDLVAAELLGKESSDVVTKLDEKVAKVVADQ